MRTTRVCEQYQSVLTDEFVGAITERYDFFVEFDLTSALAFSLNIFSLIGGCPPPQAKERVDELRSLHILSTTISEQLKNLISRNNKLLNTVISIDQTINQLQLLSNATDEAISILSPRIKPPKKGRKAKSDFRAFLFIVLDSYCYGTNKEVSVTWNNYSESYKGETIRYCEELVIQFFGRDKFTNISIGEYIKQYKSLRKKLSNDEHAQSSYLVCFSTYVGVSKFPPEKLRGKYNSI